MEDTGRNCSMTEEQREVEEHEEVEEREEGAEPEPVYRTPPTPPPWSCIFCHLSNPHLRGICRGCLEPRKWSIHGRSPPGGYDCWIFPYSICRRYLQILYIIYQLCSLLQKLPLLFLSIKKRSGKKEKKRNWISCNYRKNQRRFGSGFSVEPCPVPSSGFSSANHYLQITSIITVNTEEASWLLFQIF